MDCACGDWRSPQSHPDLGEFLAQTNLERNAKRGLDPTGGYSIKLTHKLLRSFFKCLAFVDTQHGRHLEGRRTAERSLPPLGQFGRRPNGIKNTRPGVPGRAAKWPAAAH
jgi:hypothetical protein